MRARPAVGSRSRQGSKRLRQQAVAQPPGRTSAPSEGGESAALSSIVKTASELDLAPAGSLGESSKSGSDAVARAHNTSAAKVRPVDGRMRRTFAFRRSYCHPTFHLPDRISCEPNQGLLLSRRLTC
jgi:hypothetical protein